MLDEIVSKTVHNDEESDRLNKRSKTLNEAKPAESINKNPQSFLEMPPV